MHNKYCSTGFMAQPQLPHLTGAIVVDLTGDVIVAASTR